MVAARSLRQLECFWVYPNLTQTQPPARAERAEAHADAALGRGSVRAGAGAQDAEPACSDV